MRGQVFLICWLTLVLVPLAAAIGISPPIVQLEYVPGHTYDIPVKLSNYNNFPVGVEVRVEGAEGAGFFVKKPITIPANGATTTVVSFTVPSQLDRPGYRTNYIFFKESFVDKTSGTLAVRTEVGMRVTLWQPYPGHYAEITASAPSVGEGNDTVLKTVIYNYGVEPIEGGKATVRVVSPGGEVREVYTFPGINLAGNTNTEFFEQVPSRTYAPGRYALEAVLTYAANVSRMNGSFVVGTQDVDIISLEGPIYLDKPVNRFKIHVESLWNLAVENVHGSFELGTTTAPTPPISLLPFGKDSLNGYWETDKTVPVGTPLVHVTVFFGNGLKKEAVLPIQVYNETPPDPMAVQEEDPTIVALTGSDIIFMILAMILVVCLILFAASKWRRKEKQPPQNDSTASLPPAEPVQPAPPKP